MKAAVLVLFFLFSNFFFNRRTTARGFNRVYLYFAAAQLYPGNIVISTRALLLFATRLDFFTPKCLLENPPPRNGGVASNGARLSPEQRFFKNSLPKGAWNSLKSFRDTRREKEFLPLFPRFLSPASSYLEQQNRTRGSTPPPSTPLQCFHPRVFAFSLVHPRFVHAPFEFIVRPKTLDRPRDPLLEDARLDRPAQIRYLFAFFDTITNYMYGKLFPRRLIEEENSSRIYERFPKRSCRQYVNFSRLNWPLGQAGSLITSRLISVYSLRE